MLPQITPTSLEGSVKKFLLGVLVVASTLPIAPASAEPCIVWDPPPPHVEPDCSSEIFDLIADGTAGLDPIVCAALQSAGAPAVVNALGPAVSMDADDCDLYVEGERFIDFVPYED